MEPDLTRDACIFIPFQEKVLSSKSKQYERDLANGAERRLATCQYAWSTCLERMKEIVSHLYNPVTTAVVHEIRIAYVDVLPGLPHPELPLITVSGGHSIVHDVAQVISQRSVHGGSGRRSTQSTRPASYVTHVYPADCTNIMSIMQTLISGFVKSSIVNESSRRKPATSLALYDIRLLEAWYRAINPDGDQSLNLVTVIHDFEQCDIAVMQDLFHICSRHIPKLPLIFLASSSSTSISNFLQSAYPRATLSLLRARHIHVPSPVNILEEVVAKTFFNPNFLPEIMVGPATLKYLEERFSGSDNSIDGIYSVLQIAHIKHFEEPLTILAHDELLGGATSAEAIELLSQPSSFEFLDALLMRVLSFTNTSSGFTPDLANLTIPRVLGLVAEARTQFQHRLLGMQRAYNCLRLLQTWLASQGYKASLNSSVGGVVPPALGVMYDILIGRVDKEMKYLGTAVSKLRAEKLVSLSALLINFFEMAPDQVREHEQATAHSLAEITGGMEQFVSENINDVSSQDLLPARDPQVVEAAQALSRLVLAFLDARLQPLDAGSNYLWDIWYMGSVPFPTNLLDPAPRASILSALLYPHLYSLGDVQVGDDNAPPDVASQRTKLWELPDTSILFWRYLEAGRMINAYDWYESFKQILDVQREQATTAEHATPKKNRGSAEEVVTDEEDEEKWGMEIQARFMRALHELDFLGFIKHTGRKADHVIRTTYDLE